MQLNKRPDQQQAPESIGSGGLNQGRTGRSGGQDPQTGDANEAPKSLKAFRKLTAELIENIEIFREIRDLVDIAAGGGTQQHAPRPKLNAERVEYPTESSPSQAPSAPHM